MAREMINIHEAKTHLSKLLEVVMSGKEIVIAKAGHPVARLVPYKKKQRQPGLAKGQVTQDFFDPLPDEELEAWQQ